MPYVSLFRPQEEEDPNEKAKQEGLYGFFSGGRAQSSAPGAAASPVAISQPAGGPGGVADDSGSSFVNFERYVNANKDVATRGANQLGDRVEDKARDAALGLGSAYGQFSDAVKAGTPTYDDSLGVKSGTFGAQFTNSGSTQNKPPPAGATTPTASPFTTPGGNTRGAGPTIGAQPAPTAAKPPTREEIEAGSKATYTGPESLSSQVGFDAVTGKIGDAAREVNALQSKEGLSAMIDRDFNPATAGGQELDTVLFGRTGGDRFRSIGQGYGDLASRVGRATADADRLVTQARSASEGAAGKYKDLLGRFDTLDAELKSTPAFDIDLTGGATTWLKPSFDDGFGTDGNLMSGYMAGGLQEGYKGSWGENAVEEARALYDKMSQSEIEALQKFIATLPPATGVYDPNYTQNARAVGEYLREIAKKHGINYRKSEY